MVFFFGGNSLLSEYFSKTAVNYIPKKSRIYENAAHLKCTLVEVSILSWFISFMISCKEAPFLVFKRGR